MSQPGIGAMLHYLGGGSEHSADEYYGRKITRAWLDGDRFNISFTDGTQIAIWDNGQSCCENRYITMDDDPSILNGGTLNRIETKDAPDIKDEYGEDHEQVFIEIGTSEGNFITFTTHNEHNGYYGGFGLTITEEVPA